MKPAGAVLTLPIASIAVPAERIGFYDAAHAQRLGDAMVAKGQHDPIHLQRNGDDAALPWTLIAGLHRLRGAEGAGLAMIDAIEVADPAASADELRRLELSENLDHRHRRPIERAIFMAALARLEEAIDHPGHVGESRQARGGRMKAAAKDKMSSASWRERAAAVLDCDPKTLQRYERIHRAIVVEMADVAERINFHPLCTSFSAVNAIASREPIARKKIAAKLFERDDWQSMDAVLDAAGVKATAGTRVDQSRGDLVTVDRYRKLSRHLREATFLAVAAQSPPSWVLAAADRALGRKKRRRSDGKAGNAAGAANR